MVDLRDIERAAERIAGRVRRTPLWRPHPARQGLPESLTLKLESLQATGSFKARGAISKLMSLDEGVRARGLVTASGGNHGAAVAHAGKMAAVPTTVVVPTNVSSLKVRKIEAAGAELVVEGDAWHECDRVARRLAEESGRTYVHPYADPMVIAGQGTVALEILEEAPDTDTMLIAVGGGGLISGMAVAAKALRPNVRIVGVEPAGCPTLKASLDAGRLVEIERITTRVPTMAARVTAQINLELCRERVAEVVLVDDEAMQRAARGAWMELGLALDLSGAAALAALIEGVYRPQPGERVCALVCGAGGDGIG